MAGDLVDSLEISHEEVPSKSILSSKTIQKNDSTFYLFSELLENLGEDAVIQRPMSEILEKAQESVAERYKNPLIMGGVKRDI